MDSLNKLNPCPRFAPSESSGSTGTGSVSAYLEDAEPGGDLILGRQLPVSASSCEVKSSGITRGCSDAPLWDAVQVQLNKTDACNLAR